jgi:hypothetical protein
MMPQTLTPNQAAGFFLFLAHGLMPATHNMLEHAGQVVEDEAKRLIGTYDFANPRWPELAESTKDDRVRQGFSENEPLLRTGELRDSIHHVVIGDTAHVGSDNDKAVWQELGTKHIPPRTFLKGAVLNTADQIAHDIGKQVHAYLSSGRFPSSSGHPFTPHGEVIPV